MTDEEVQKQIDELLQTLQNWEDIDPAYMNNSLKDLRHKVMHVHLRIEASLEILIGDFVMKPFFELMVGNEMDSIRRVAFRQKMDIIFDEMDFLKKVDLALKLGKIDGKTKSKLAAVNELRKYFSHPKSYLDKIRTYNNNKAYLEALVTLKEAYESIEKIFLQRKGEALVG